MDQEDQICAKFGAIFSRWTQWSSLKALNNGCLKMLRLAKFFSRKLWNLLLFKENQSGDLFWGFWGFSFTLFLE